MQAIKDLFKSERGLFALALVAAATVLCSLDKMTIDAWREMSLYVFGIYVGGKTISGTAAILSNRGGAAESAATEAKAEAKAEAATEAKAESAATEAKAESAA